VTLTGTVRAGVEPNCLLLEAENGSSVVKGAVFGQVAAVCCDRCWSATRHR
jgi:hypothetical protein